MNSKPQTSNLKATSNCKLPNILRLMVFGCFVICSLMFDVAAASEAYRIKVVNSRNGEISVSQDQGKTWQKAGKVLYPTQKVTKRGYMASAWVDHGEVAATAVNAIHIKASAKGTKTIFSLLPWQMMRVPKGYPSFVSPSSTIYTNISAGTGIFGGGAAPFVGSRVLVQRPAEQMLEMPAEYVPKLGETLYIIVARPELPQAIVFENKFGGKVIAKYGLDDERIVGQVLYPAVGIGRFAGTNFAGVGRIRANHAGVIDVSTSRIGQVGGFQIIPAVHTADMPYVKHKTQWMVVGPADVEGQTLEGTPPLFKDFIQPNYQQKDLLSRYLVEVQYEKSEDWVPMPVLEVDKFYLRKNLPTWADTALGKISHVRILLPIKNSGHQERTAAN